MYFRYAPGNTLKNEWWPGSRTMASIIFTRKRYVNSHTFWAEYEFEYQESISIVEVSWEVCQRLWWFYFARNNDKLDTCHEGRPNEGWAEPQPNPHWTCIGRALKARAGCGRKREERVEGLHQDLRDEFEWLTRLGVKFNLTTLSQSGVGYSSRQRKWNIQL